MQIRYTDYAKAQLRMIVRYYRENASVKVADKIRKEIMSHVRTVGKYPESGQSENSMERFKLTHRRLVTGNYKIIYRIISGTIFITDIFDSRQSPEKQNP